MLRIRPLQEYRSFLALLEAYIDRLYRLPESQRRVSWIRRVAKSIRNGMLPPTELMIAWEQAAAQISTLSQREDLKQRFAGALPQNPTQYRRNEYDAQFLDVVVEMLAASYFTTREFGEPAFLETGGEPTPEFLCGDSVVVEVKNIHPSDAERDYFDHHQGEVRSGWNPFEFSSDNPLLRKIVSTFARQVLPKFESYPAKQYSRCFFANFSFDIVSLSVDDQYPEAKAAFFAAVAELLLGHDVSFVAIERYSLHRQLMEPTL